MEKATGKRQCLFCGGDLTKIGRAREHIIPVWLQEEWGLSDQVVAPTHFDKNGSVVSERLHTVSGLLAGRVCAPCNNGWMSRLENSARPLILDIAEGRRRIFSLKDNEALLLARWTAKTCYALNAGTNYRRFVPMEHPHTLVSEDYRLPGGVFVVGHAFGGGRDFSWAQTASWELLILQGDEAAISQQMSSEGYKIALRLGGLFLMTLYVPTPDSRVVLELRKHVPLYPRWSHPVVWKKRDRSWRGKVAERFFQFVISAGVAVDTTGRWEW
jgi:hypothetical protein